MKGDEPILSRRKACFFVPLLFAFGAIDLGFELSDQGASRTVLSGIAAGGLIVVGLIYGVARNWRRRQSRRVRAEQRAQFARAHSTMVLCGTGAGLIAVSIVGASGGAEAFLRSLVGVLVMGGSILAGVIAFSGKGMCDVPDG